MRAALLALSIAGWEWARLFGQPGFTGSLAGVLGLIWVMLLDVQLPERGLMGPGVALVLMLTLLQMVIRTGRNYPHPENSFMVALAGGLYLGWMGIHLVLLRNLPDGMYWTLIALPAIFAADTLAYIFGRLLGRHKLAPRISPGKTWEGYIAGVIGAVVITGLLAALWATQGAASTFADGAIIGLLVGGLGVVGDLGISAFKRQMGVKDSSHLLPGHGGILDRLDSVLVAAAVGYYYVVWFIL
ncbi:MAG: phosphatidate cytidylyltransferase [Anaerolineae bacterium]|nr:phosphatidate cytidylyltransferase [Anaerolineae bacterium]